MTGLTTRDALAKVLYDLAWDGEQTSDYEQSFETHRDYFERQADAILASGVILSLIAEQRSKALQAAAQVWLWSAWADTPRHAERAQDRIAAAQYVGDWLKARAEKEKSP